MGVGGTSGKRTDKTPPRTAVDGASDTRPPAPGKGPAADPAGPPSAPGDSFGTAAPGAPPRAGGPAPARPVTGSGTTEAPADALKAKLDSGDLTTQDFQGLRRGQVADLVSKLAAGNLDQRDNLVRLMSDSAFAGNLGTALNEMAPADRTRVMKSVGEVQGSQAAAVQGTLAAALDGMVPSRRDEALRDSLLSRDTAALGAANGYLSAKPQAAAGFIKSVTSDSTVDDAKLGNVFDGMSPASRGAALKSLSSGLDGEARDVFKRLGDAVYDSKQDPTRSKLEQALDSLSNSDRNNLLKKVISDSAGNQRTDQQVNKGQRLVAEYLDRKGPRGVEQFLASVPSSDQASFQSFIKQNVRNDDVQRALNPPPGSVNGAKVAAADKWSELTGAGGVVGSVVQSQYLDAFTALSGAELDAHLGKMGPERLGAQINTMSPGFIGTDYTDGSRMDMLKHVEQNGGPKAKAMVAAGLAHSFQNDRPFFDGDKGHVRNQLASMLKSDPNGALREMPPSDLKNVVKAFMQPPADMGKLKEVFGELTPQSSAKLARAVQLAAPEVAAETKAGSWVGDVLKGLTVSGKAGRSSSVKVGDAKATGGEVTAGMSAEIGFSWSPAALVEGGRTREGNQVTSELNSFMSDWMAQLNRMSPNQKAIFLDEMKDVVTLRPS